MENADRTRAQLIEELNELRSVSRDITERQKAEAALRESERKFRGYIEDIAAGVVAHAPDTSILYCNQRALQILGLPMKQMLGKEATDPAWMFVNEGGAEMSLDDYPINRAMKSSENLHNYVVGIVRPDRSDVTWVDCSSFAVRDSTDEIDHILITFIDITERNRAEEEMRESEKRHRAICESVTEGILAADILTKQFRYANPAMCHMLGYSEVELRQMCVLDIHPKNARPHVLSEFEAQAKGDETVAVGIPCLRKDGTVFIADISVGKMSINGIECSVGVFTDITERKQLEAQQKELQAKVARAKRLESLGVLAGGVAHDLNNSLGPLVVLPRMILEDIQGLGMEPSKPLKDIKACLSVIEGSALRSAEVVKDLLNLSRQGQYSLKPFDLNTIICIQAQCRCQKNIRAAYQNITFTSSLSVAPLVIMADRSHLERAVGNVVHNAAESISENGRVDIRTSVVKLDEPMDGFETVPPGRYAVLEITDTGGGISKEHLPYIFEPYVTRKRKSDYSGSGLGLAVTHGVVKDHKGFIDVTSEVGKGTTFTLYFPMISVPAETTVADSEQAINLQGSERILIVDDEKSQRFFLSMGLKTFGYDVSDATNGHEAVALFLETEMAKKEAPFDIVVLDMTMEVGFDGLDTYQAILELYPTQKVIISSGHAEEGRIQTAITLGADSLQKPYKIFDLAKALRKRLDRD